MALFLFVLPLISELLMYIKWLKYLFFETILGKNVNYLLLGVSV